MSKSIRDFSFSVVLLSYKTDFSLVVKFISAKNKGKCDF